MPALVMKLVAGSMLAARGGEAATTDDTARTADAGVPAPAASDDTAAAGGTATATAAMRDAGGRELGELTLTESAQGIAVSGRLTGLPPGARAIHLHAVGRCDPPFESAGPHWNPTNREHGTQNPRGAHSGDMPNVTAAAARR
jgi:superoxide dismutase, Cu-Zn family